MKLQPLLYLPVGRVLIEHAYPMLRCTAYTVSPVHLLQVGNNTGLGFGFGLGLGTVVMTVDALCTSRAPEPDPDPDQPEP